MNMGERLLIPAMLVALAICPDAWNLRRLGAAVAALAPVLLLHLHLILPAIPPAADIGHLAAHDAAQRHRLLFWHRPFHFRSQMEAAQRGKPVRIGFTTSILRPLLRPVPNG